jgi:hypothetical protein
VPSVLGALGTIEIKLANENNQAVGRAADVMDIDFVQENDAKPLKINAGLPEPRPSAA